MIEAAAEAAEAALLREEVAIKLPEAGRTPRPAIGGKRRRDDAPPVETQQPKPTLAELQRAVTAAKAAVQVAEEVERTDEARVERARRRQDAAKPPAEAFTRILDLCSKQMLAAYAAHRESCALAEGRGEEPPPLPYASTEEWCSAEIDRRDAEQMAPFLSAKAATDAANAEAGTSKAAAAAARRAMHDAESAMLLEEARIEDEENERLWAARRDAEALRLRLAESLVDEARRLILLLQEENEELSERLRAVTPFLPPLRMVTSFDVDPDTGMRHRIKSWCELVRTSEETDEEDPWDEETAARAQAEMLAAHAAGISSPCQRNGSREGAS